jgi:hypothetical protein
MPTVLRLGAFRFIIYPPPREHGPPHVHVIRAGVEAMITLDPVSVRSVAGMRDADVVVAAQLVEHFRTALANRWKEIHGEDTHDEI